MPRNKGHHIISFLKGVELENIVAFVMEEDFRKTKISPKPPRNRFHNFIWQLQMEKKPNQTGRPLIDTFLKD